MAESENKIIASRYEIIRLIGKGGMANVYLAKDLRLQRMVAIKILRSNLADDPAFLNRFEREAHASASLNHPSIVAIYDTGKEIEVDESTGKENLNAYIVMEYVEGETLRELLKKRGSLDGISAANVAAGVLSALDYSHKHGIVHRDIKPGNIIITTSGEVKVMDFGIARAVADSNATVTQSQVVVGTAQYLSPEQGKGETVDFRSDLYSVGCVLFEMLTGEQPFTGDSSVSIVYQHVNINPRIPSAINNKIDKKFDYVVLRAMAKNVNNRYQTADQFKSDVVAVRDKKSLSSDTLKYINDSKVLSAAGMPITGAFPSDAVSATVENETAKTEIASQEPNTEETKACIPEKSDDDKSKGGTRHGKKKLTTKVKLIIAVAVLVVLGISAWAIVSTMNNANKVSVPAIPTTATEQEAKTLLENVGLVFEKEEISDSSDKGSVVKQDPEAGQMVTKGTTVKVYFSKGAKSVIIPDTTGMSQDDARKTIENVGLKVSKTTAENSATVSKDLVTRTSPASGKTVKYGDQIELYVSTGMVDLPNLVGKSKSDAQSTLNSLHLVADFEYKESSEANDTVIEQNPSAGSVTQGSTVTVYLSSNSSAITLPNVVGKTQSDATSTLEALGLVVKVQTVSGGTSGTVTKMSPSAGQSVMKGDTVTIYVAN